MPSPLTSRWDASASLSINKTFLAQLDHRQFEVDDQFRAVGFGEVGIYVVSYRDAVVEPWEIVS